MDAFLKIFLAFLIFDFLSVCYNAYYYFLTKKHFGKYNAFIQNAVEDRSDSTIQENKQAIVAIFKKANLHDFRLSKTSPAGFGYLKTASYSFFDNIAVIDMEITPVVAQYFKEAMGAFENRIWNCVNPFYWLEALIFLPKKIFSYLGISGDGLLTKILQVLWWLVVAASTIIGIVFNSEFRAWLSAHFRFFS